MHVKLGVDRRERGASGRFDSTDSDVFRVVSRDRARSRLYSVESAGSIDSGTYFERLLAVSLMSKK
jgi:hypothetical protein